MRHQGPDPTGGERLVHPARSDRQFRPAAERRGGADRGLLVDTRGYIYITDKNWGMWILRYSGPNQPTPTDR
jgi:hypothetical protein